MSDAPDLHPDEWQLWRIPERELRIGLAWEIERERHRRVMEQDPYWPMRENLPPEVAASMFPPPWPPWLFLPPDARAKMTDPLPMAAWPDIDPEPPDAAPWKRPRRWGDPPNVRHRYFLHTAGFGEWEGAEHLAAQFVINPNAPRRDILEGFERWMDQSGIGTEKTHRGERKNLLQDRLMWLALYRLHRAAEMGADFWAPFDGRGEPWHFWGRNDTPASIRGMIARLGWFEKVEKLIAEAQNRLEREPPPPP